MSRSRDSHIANDHIGVRRRSKWYGAWRRWSLVGLVLVIAVIGLHAQEASNGGGRELRAQIDALGLGTLIQVETTDATRFQGQLLDVLDDRLEIVVADGSIVQVYSDAVVSVRELGNDQRNLFEDSAANRLVIMPTAFPLDPGEFHVASQEIIAVTGSYGITQSLSVWGGISIPGALFSLRGSFAVAQSMGLSIGSFVGASWLDLSLGPLVLPYALVSFGDPIDNLTIGSGFAMTFSDGFSIPGVVLAIGGKRAINAGSAIVTENWIVWTERFVDGGDDALSWVPFAIAPSAVFRIAGNRLSWDIGAVVPFFIDGSPGGPYTLQDPVIPIPVLSLTYRIS